MAPRDSSKKNRPPLQNIRVEAPRFISESLTWKEGQPIDYVAAVEAAYALDVDDADWLTGILRALRPALDCGMGASGWMYRVLPDGHQVATPVFIGCSMKYFEALSSAGPHISVEHMRQTYLQAKPCASLAETWERWSPELFDGPSYAALRAIGVVDQLVIRARNPDMTGSVVGAPSPERSQLSPRRRSALTRVATHIAAGQRLRRALRGDTWSVSQPEAGSVDAVLTPDGAPVHAERDVKGKALLASLARATRSRSESRGSLRVEKPERALELWQGLVQGRWTLVDTVDTDGKRFVLARRNAPRPRAFDKLDAEERCVLSYAAFGHSNKDMAYELGCSMNAISATLSRGLRKLGLRSRAELAVVFGAQLFPPRSDSG